MSVTAEAASSNGHDPDRTDQPTPPVDGPLAHLRATPENVHLFRGYGPLVAGIVLFVLMVTLAPTVAPERTVERPTGDATTTSSVVGPDAGEVAP
ncbi:MAG: hypothetical protein ACO1PW_14520 [Actinomycetota bacterium]